MGPPDPRERRLQPWLQHISEVHWAEMDPGLVRCQQVGRRLDVLRPAPTVIAVAGTNGKGSVVACLEAALVRSGCRTGCYTSPHLETFNERLRLDGMAASDGAIAGALAAVEAARGEVSLSYFEFATLAALYLFARAEVEFAVLEVGMGGRLDAVNTVDPQLSIITCIDLDHQQWLGPDRTTIAREKAGILRPGVPFVCADPDPAPGLVHRARQLGCPVYRAGQEFDLSRMEKQLWRWQLRAKEGESLQLDTPEPPRLAAVNVVSAVQGLLLLDVPLPLSRLIATCSATTLPGRQEWRTDRQSARRVLLDVAHNPSAITLLTSTLAADTRWDRLLVVLAVMVDKAAQEMARCLDSHAAIWYIAQVKEARCLAAGDLAEQVHRSGSQRPLRQFSSVEHAYRAACSDAAGEDVVLVTGSFHTVAAVRSLTRA